ncbi:MAG: hypothetical protein AAGI63_07080 [Planctomycetota bacterium]
MDRLRVAVVDQASNSHWHVTSKKWKRNLMVRFAKNHLGRLRLLAFGVVLSLASSVSVSPTMADWTLSDMVSKDGNLTTYHAKPIPRQLKNEWPQELEDAFQRRSHAIIQLQTRDTKAGVNTYFENEKRTYGFLMAHVLGGNDKNALKFLQARDHQHQEWHRETAGIDYYACFTLKHQMRKYFYFGDLLDADYRRQMYEGARRWTEHDPLRRPHYAYQSQDGPPQGWGPNVRNSWVDVRSTENLYLMRTTSVYLMAEATGNQATAQKYKQHLLDYTRTLYRIGIGEWDSENYHGHSIAPLLNVYDFAEDPEVKSAAKACLDFFAAAGAVKYFRGGFNGPTKRDYNHAQPFGGSAPNSLWVWFGDHPAGKVDRWESDEVHQITSAYRPPMAVVNLAQKKFKRPVEIFAGKPAYDATTGHRSESQPEYAETQFIANSYLMGSLTAGTSVDGGDVNGFKILAYDEQKGAVALHACPSRNPAYPGSPMYKSGVVAAPNRVAQQENLALWLVEDGDSPWLWVVPEDVEIVQKSDVTFLKCDRTWVAIRSLGGTQLARDASLTKQLSDNKKNRFPGHQVLSCQGSAENYCGLAIEVGEQESHGTFRQFVADVLNAEVDISQLDDGIARYRSVDGKWLGIHWQDDPLNLGVWRNGKRRDLTKLQLYDSDVISSKWGSGVLTVNAGGESFQHRVP